MSHMWRESHIGSKDGLASRFKHHSVLTRKLALPTKRTCVRDAGPNIVSLEKRQISEQLLSFGCLTLVQRCM